MTIRQSWKRVVAGVLAVLVMAGTIPTNFGRTGLFGGTTLTASATDEPAGHGWTVSGDS